VGLGGATGNGAGGAVAGSGMVSGGDFATRTVLVFRATHLPSITLMPDRQFRHWVETTMAGSNWEFPHSGHSMRMRWR
jgi:hypothetical protein